ncbi:MFS transporter [Aerococcus loyolae]|uniref:MFS transporter n=3 Tax=Bacillati TaxID=1783272 RepID=A0A2I1L4X5_9LACT|nr:MFS transporter [Aerococcus loyolae]KAA9264040.1 MFS transporter [Aerococcus loyolae]PKY81680.1 MFS transporter [Aerococcus loyolae]PKZ02940.1 MFS transporter [Aerococcus loyolae]RAV65245.1 MFS transporter [Aerococcus loyolae]
MIERGDGMKGKYLILTIIMAFTVAGSVGLNINSVGVFLGPVSKDLNVMTGTFAIHATLISFGTAFAAFAVPGVLKRFSFKKVLIVSTLVTALSTMAMGFSNAMWQFYILAFTRGVFAAVYGIVPLQLLINNWYKAKHGTVSSVVFAFSGVAGAIFAPMLTQLIQSIGWRQTYLVQALLFVLLALPAIIYPFAFDPRDENKLPYGYQEEDADADEAAVDSGEEVFSYTQPTFLLLIVASLLITALTGLAQHFPAIGEEYGYLPTMAALMVSAGMLGNIIFKIIIGFISDAKGAMVSVYTMLATMVLGLIVIMTFRVAEISLLGSFLYGAVYSISAVGLALVTKHIFSLKLFDRVYPSVNFIANAGAAVAVSMYGYLYDFSGSYRLAIILSIILAVVSFLCLFLADRMKSGRIKA